jgi:hypothetical protein
MDHPYLSQRRELVRADEALGLLDDLETLLRMSPDDRARVAARREAEIADVRVAAALRRRAGRLGALLEDVDDDGALAAAHGEAWRAFLVGGSGVDVDALVAALAEPRAALQRTRDACARVEGEDDDASSSYSDYSDERTTSSSSSSGGRGGSGDESDE